MHAISSYRGNRHTRKHTHTPAQTNKQTKQTDRQTNPQTGPITIQCADKLSAQCNTVSHAGGPEDHYVVFGKKLLFTALWKIL